WTSWWTGKQAFPPQLPFPDFAEILRIPAAKSAPVVAVRAAGHDWNSSGPKPSRALPAFCTLILREDYLTCPSIL
ncbi:MAG: hypothetical protein PUD50_11295, partial [Eubacteriales bacterium]|nr:hypothetical protein [Eubacteriales bacterium]